MENEKLRVHNENINCLFSNLNPHSFDTIYNEFDRCLNLNFEPLVWHGKELFLTPAEQRKLKEIIITNWIYFYTINNLKVVVNPADFKHPHMVDYVLGILDKKLGVDTEESLLLGARLLRMKDKAYRNTVEGRRRYYER